MRTCDLLKFAVAYHGSLCPLFVWTRRGKKRSANCSEMSTPKDFRVVSTALAHYCGILVCAMLICATEWRLYKLQLYNCAAKSSKIVIIVIVPDFDWVRINGDYRIWERVKVKKKTICKSKQRPQKMGKFSVLMQNVFKSTCVRGIWTLIMNDECMHKMCLICIALSVQRFGSFDEDIFILFFYQW